MRSILALAVLLTSSAVASLAQATWTQIDNPNAVYGTILAGINTNGDIVGWYYDASFNGQGFLLRGGVYTSIQYAGAQSTNPYGINDQGEIVGTGTPIAGGGGFYLIRQLRPLH